LWNPCPGSFPAPYLKAGDRALQRLGLFVEVPDGDSDFLGLGGMGLGDRLHPVDDVVDLADALARFRSPVSSGRFLWIRSWNGASGRETPAAPRTSPMCSRPEPMAVG
jgi:hypothetical protein